MKKQTKHLLTFVAVAAVGYLAYNYYKKQQAAKAAAAGTPATDANTSSFMGGGQIIANRTGMSNAAAKQMYNRQWKGSAGRLPFNNQTVLGG